MSWSGRSVQIFCSYAHADEAFLRKLQAHLSPLERQGLLAPWHDRLIVPGTNWAEAIDTHLNMASIILLLISPDFFVDSYCFGKELTRALERHQANEARVVPILLRPVDWQGSPFAHLQILPTNAEPITTWSNEDAAFVDVVAGIRQALEEVAGFSTNSPPLTYSPVLEPYFAHPYPLQESFTGRIHERQMLTEWFISRRHPILVLTALGGMGKSSLAWVWVQHDILNRPSTDLALQMTEAASCSFPRSSSPEGIFWWSFYEHEASFPAFLNEVLAYAGNRMRSPSAFTTISENVKALLVLLQQRRLLLVLDGFERELRAYASLSAIYTGDGIIDDPHENIRACTNPHLTDFLRRATALPLKSRILLTSRLFPQELDGVVGCRREELSALDPEDAVTFFHAQEIQGTREEIQKIGTLHGYHPLTLRLLAGLIRDNPADPGNLAISSKYHPVSNLVQRKHHILALAYDTLSPSTRELLSRLAAFRSQTEFRMAKVVSPFQSDEELEAAVKELIARGLLSFDRLRGRYDLHPIVRQYAYDRLVDKQGVHGRLRDYFASLSNPQLIQQLEDLAPVIELYHHTLGSGQYDEAFQLYSERIRTPLYYQLGEYELDIQILDAIPRAPNGIPALSNHEAQVWILLYTTMVYERVGRAKAGLKYAEQALQIARKDRDLYNIGTSLSLYSMSACDLGQLQQASAFSREAVPIFEYIRFPFWIGTSHRCYGRVLMYCGDFLGALKEFESAEKAYNALRLDNHGHGVLLLFRAQLSLLQGDPTEAYRVAQQARSWSQKLSFKLEEIKAMWLVGAAQIALVQEKNARQHQILTEAHTLLTKALTECRRIHLLDVEADLLLTLACWYNAVGEREQAWKHTKEALTIADHAEYQLKRADIQNMMAQMALEAQAPDTAYQYAHAAYHAAWCDGPPYCYKPALERAKQLLQQARSPQGESKSQEGGSEKEAH